MSARVSITSGQFFRWGLAHPDLIVQLGDTAMRLPTLKTCDEKWKGAIRPLGDKLAPAIDELMAPRLSAVSATANRAIRTELLAVIAGSHGKRRKAAAPRDGRWLQMAFQLFQFLAPLLTK